MSKITVNIAYLNPPQHHILKVEIEENSTILQAIISSNILQLVPEINLHIQHVGVFGKLRKLTDVPVMGDRIEIYRPLKIDPKDARRLKAKNKST